jgi:hypothetical protein
MTVIEARFIETEFSAQNFCNLIFKAKALNPLISDDLIAMIGGLVKAVNVAGQAVIKASNDAYVSRKANARTIKALSACIT